MTSFYGNMHMMFLVHFVASMFLLINLLANTLNLSGN